MFIMVFMGECHHQYSKRVSPIAHFYCSLHIECSGKVDEKNRLMGKATNQVPSDLESSCAGGVCSEPCILFVFGGNFLDKENGQ